MHRSKQRRLQRYTPPAPGQLELIGRVVGVQMVALGAERAGAARHLLRNIAVDRERGGTAWQLPLSAMAYQFV
jgi:hypothetical protein